MTKFAHLSAKEKKAAYDNNRRINRAKWLAELKKGPCVDCGGSFPHPAMDFHHLSGKGNKFNFGTAKKSKVLKEIKECILLCANCHRLRHCKHLESI